MQAGPIGRTLIAAGVIALLILAGFPSALGAQSGAIHPAPRGKPPASPGHIGSRLRCGVPTPPVWPEEQRPVPPLRIDTPKAPDARMSLGPQPFQGPIFWSWSPLDYSPAGRGRHYAAPFYERDHADYGLAGMLLGGMFR